MLDQINQDIKEAMKAKEKSKLEALRYLKSMLMENSTSKKPKPEQDVIISHARKLKDSLEQFPSGSELHDKTLTELTHLQPYLPKQLSQSEVSEIIQAIINDLEQPNFGQVMKELSPQIKGRFDGKAAAGLVKDILEAK